MAEDQKPTANKDNPEDGNNNPEKPRIKDGVIGAEQQTTSEHNGQASGDHPKPSVIVRMWRGLWRRRVWRRIRKQGSAPHWAEITSMVITGGIFLAACIQAVIYWEQAQLMQESLNQNERAVILNMGQLAVANRNADISAQSLQVTTRPWIGFKDIKLKANLPEHPTDTSTITAEISGRLRNYGNSPAVRIFTKFVDNGEPPFERKEQSADFDKVCGLVKKSSEQIYWNEKEPSPKSEPLHTVLFQGTESQPFDSQVDSGDGKETAAKLSIFGTQIYVRGCVVYYDTLTSKIAHTYGIFFWVTKPTGEWQDVEIRSEDPH